MKKLLALLLAALMVLSLAACSMEGGSSEPAKTEETTAAPETTETETEQPAEETAAPEVKADADITIAVVPKSLDNAIFLDSQAAAEAKAKFDKAMDDDLNTPDALAALFDLVKEINTLSGAAGKSVLEQVAATFDELTGVLGILYNRKKDEVPAEVTALVEKRAAAKKAKDWATADAIRAELTAMGWAVKDTAQGPQLSKL